MMKGQKTIHPLDLLLEVRQALEDVKMAGVSKAKAEHGALRPKLAAFVFSSQASQIQYIVDNCTGDSLAKEMTGISKIQLTNSS